MSKSRPKVGLGYRRDIVWWILDSLDHLEVIEITVDHCLAGNAAASAEIYELVGRVPLRAHGIGLSIGTDMPLDVAYLDRVAAVVERLGAPAYSEHLAFTRVPGRDLANLLPLPRTEAAAEMVIGKVREIRSRLGVPFLLENIAYVFDWPQSELSDADFLTLICTESGAGVLLDIENLYLNSRNYGFDAYGFLDALPAGLVKEVHVAGGVTIRDAALAKPFLADSHSHPMPGAVLDLLDHVLLRQRPDSIILERDERLDAVDEIVDDLARIRARLDRSP